jgi:hypothetical protein
MRIPLRGLAVVAAVAALSGAVVWLLRPARPTTPEERIRALLDRAAQAAEQRKLGEVMDALSPRFAGEGGEGWRADRDEVRRMLGLQLLRGQWVSVLVSSAEIAVEGPRARAHVDVVLSRSDEHGRGLAALLPGEASAHRLRLELEEEAGEWRVVAGAWRSIGLEEALAGPGPPDW